MTTLPRLSLGLVLGCFLLIAACQSPSTSDSGLQDTQQALIGETVFGFSTQGLKVVQDKIQANEHLSGILERFQVSQAHIAHLALLPQDLFDVRKLQANKPYTVLCSNDSLAKAQCFIYQPNAIEYVAIEFGDSVTVTKGSREVDTLTHTLSGIIESSLYASIVNAGGSPALVNALAEIYAWEIDFFGLQEGDAYSIFFTTYEVEGNSVGFGEILSSSFTHMGKERLAFLYDQGEGHDPAYFDEEGNSLRKTFLKAPLSYTRISSHFSYSRLHPVLKIRRPHLGVDYAAPSGTPVVSIGDGVVLKAEWGGGGGKTIRIRHNSNYETAYLHLLRYADGIRPGTHVSQGQVIGYVGSTGLSTGPHLDFRFYKNGTPIDPLSIDSPAAEPIREENMLAFRNEISRFLQVIDDLHRVEARERWMASSGQDAEKGEEG